MFPCVLYQADVPMLASRGLFGGGQSDDTAALPPASAVVLRVEIGAPPRAAARRCSRVGYSSWFVANHLPF